MQKLVVTTLQDQLRLGWCWVHGVVWRAFQKKWRETYVEWERCERLLDGAPML